MKNTSVALGEHFDGFIHSQVESGRYKSASEVMRAALRLLEDEAQKRNAIVQALIEGEESGISERTPYEIREAVKAKARLDGII